MAAVILGALKVLASNGSLYSGGALHRTELWVDRSHNRCVIVQIAELLLSWDHRLPLLLVEREHQSGLSTCRSLWRVEDKRVVIDLLDLSDVAKNLASLCLYELCVQRGVIS